VAVIAASDPSCHILHHDPNRDPDWARLEPVSVHIAVEIDGQALMLPVPLSMYSNSYNIGDLVELLKGGMFWEIRSGDTNSARARLGEAFPCGIDCRWTTEESDTVSAVDYVLDHGDGCEDSDDQLAIETAA
jgi:hypothetical protein